MDTYRLAVTKEGMVTLPRELRETYRIQEGDSLTLVDMGGVFVVSPEPSRIDELADRLARDWAASGESLESMLKALKEVRDQYGAEG